MSYKSLAEFVEELQDLSTVWKHSRPLPEELHPDRQAFLLDSARSEGLRFAGRRLQEALDRLFE